MKADFLTHIAALPLPASGDYAHGTPFAQALAHGSMTVELFAPGTSGLGHDIQQPHTQDELYFVQRGQADFWHRRTHTRVQAGDALFVPAGDAHRFENFTENFATWVVFYGPQGGEK